jgi:peptidoglycan LD-endopeptidase LytH
MNHLIYSICLLGVLFWSCSTTGPGVFKKKSLHEQYGKRIKDAGLDQTALGQQWFTEAEKALRSPQNISLPYKEMGYFSSNYPRAVGLNFNAKRGQKLLIDLERNPNSGFLLFVELWETSDVNKPSMLLSFDTSRSIHEYEVDETGNYLIRLQPELLRSGDYTLSISIGASFSFPVAGAIGRIGSVWGDERDAGARRHEGIDLFAPKRTPVIAAADGIITRVNENNLGGKVVWQRPKGKNLSLYYAHLDEQLVTDGQEVKAGDTIGLVGNTGNARSTPPHLHFGIYALGGAIDPLPFVDPVIKRPSPLAESIGAYKEELRTSAAIKLDQGNRVYQLKANTIVQPIAIGSKNLRIMLPDSSFASIPLSKVEKAGRIKSSNLKDSTFIYEGPGLTSVRKVMLHAGDHVSVWGYFEEFAYIKTEAGTNGWIPASSLKQTL